MLARVHEPQELDRGPKAGPAPERLCAVTREAKPADEMMRFVRSPDGDVVPDVKRKLPGRGIWITATRQAIAEGVKRNVFARGFKAEVRMPADLSATAEHLLERAALDALAIAGKAGQVLHGFAKVENAIRRGEARVIVHAADAAEDGKRKINAYLRGESADLPVIEAFTTGQLDLALGRSNVVHAALLAGSATDTFVARAARLARFRAPDTAIDKAPPRADA